MLKRFPIYIFLLPLFFILNKNNQYAGLLDAKDCSITGTMVLAGNLLVFLLFKWIFKNSQKAALITFVAGIFYLYFGELKSALHSLAPILGSYKVFCIIVLLVLSFLLLGLKKRELSKTTGYYLNILLVILIAIEIMTMAFRVFGSVKDPAPSLKISGDPPGIYYLVPDTYPSISFQDEMLNIDNSVLDSGLRHRGFYIIPGSISNYNSTAFSMASVLNMEYVPGLKQEMKARPVDYNKSTRRVKHSKVINALEKAGYSVINLSNFDLEGHKALRKERFLTATTSQILLYNTGWNCFIREIGINHFPSVRKKIESIQQKENEEVWGGYKAYNKTIIDSLSHLPLKNTAAKFVYAHLEMPHFPYFFDSSGKEYPDTTVYNINMIKDRERFRQYVIYTGKLILNLVDSIRQKDPTAIIIIQSDHALNDFEPSRKNDAFRNFSAFYLPGSRIDKLYKGMSNVNTFRVIFNEYFGTNLPLLPDTTIYIR